MKLKSRILYATFLCLFLVQSFARQPAQGKRENTQTIAKIKIAFIYNFTKYVFWPREDNMTSFKICVMNSPELARYLHALANIKKFRDRIPIEILACKSADEIPNCEMLIVDGSSNDNLWSAYSKIRGKSVLMIAENLKDYKKSMIAFTEVEGHMKYIINKTKMNEAKLVVNELLYTLAITKEGEWKSIFDKFNSLLESSDNEVKIDKADLVKMMSLYKSLEDENNIKGNTIMQMEDSMRRRLHAFNLQMTQYKKVSQRIEEQKKTLQKQQQLMAKQKSEISIQETEIGKQRTVIAIIALLTIGVFILLFFAIRSNTQRRRANILLSRQKNEIGRQKQLVDEKQKEILDSINYAKRIQTALLANSKLLNDNLPEHFVLFKPKDIVAGDFYWAAPLRDSFVYITADCTGHGVPGAFMSLLNISKLNEAINQKHITRPDLILNDVKTEIIRALNPEGSQEESKDGMDAILCKIDFKNMRLQYAAANNSFCIIRNNELLVCKADKIPVGKSHNDTALFTYNEIALQKGDMVYTYTDGYGDQFGGPKGKKFKHKKLKEIMIAVATKSMEEQKQFLDQNFEHWKGNLEQVDDVLIIGVRV